MSSRQDLTARPTPSPPPQLDALPIFDDVQDYEKIQRIGEGTYGVVCKLHTAQHPRARFPEGRNRQVCSCR